MSVYKFLNISLAIDAVIEKINKRHTVEKAGIWQATDLFKDEDMLVLRNYFWRAPVPASPGMLLVQTEADPGWVEEHFQERVSGIPSNPGESYKRWPYNNFDHNNDPFMGTDKKFSHTYQERFWPKHAGERPIRKQIQKDPPKFEGYTNHKGIRYELGDLTDVIKQLKDNPLTRQAYLPIFFPEDTGAVPGERVPCTLGYYFWIQNNMLHCNYMIRSCDIFRHFRNDIYLTGRLIQHIASKLEIETGSINFMAFNLHLFKNDIYAFKKVSRNNLIWR